MNINIPNFLHCNIFYFSRYAHVRYVKYLFTNIQKQQNMLKISLFYEIYKSHT